MSFLNFSWWFVPLIITIFTGILCPAMGTVLITHRRLLQVNLISHCVLPGLALALALGIHPSIGGVISGLTGAIIAERENIVVYFAQAGLITLLLNLLMMFIAYYISKSLIENQSQQRAITLECGLQNGTLAIVVANVFFDGGAYLIPAATYSLIMYITALPYIYYLRRN